MDLFTQTWGVNWEVSQLMDNELNEVNEDIKMKIHNIEGRYAAKSFFHNKSHYMMSINYISWSYTYVRYFK